MATADMDDFPPQPQSIAQAASESMCPWSSPIPDSAGDGPFKPTWDSLLEYEAPEWYQDAKFGIWGALESAVRGGRRGLVRPQYV